MSLAYCWRMSLPSAAGGAQHSLDDACCTCGQCPHRLGLFSGGLQPLKTLKCKTRFEMGYCTFPCEPFCSAWLWRNPSQSSAGVDNSTAACPGAPWLGRTGSSAVSSQGQAVLPVGRADGKWAGKSSFLWVQIDYFTERHKVNFLSGLFPVRAHLKWSPLCLVVTLQSWTCWLISSFNEVFS